MIMLKKFISLLVIFIMIISLAGCKKDARPDFSELLIRTEKYYKDAVFDFGEAFYSDSCWYLFFSAVSEDDVLIKAYEDENRRLLSVRVSMLDNGDEGNEAAFIKISSAVAKAWCDVEDIDEFLKNTGLYDENIIFSEQCRTYEQGRYKAEFYNSAFGSSLDIHFVM